MYCIIEEIVKKKKSVEKQVFVALSNWFEPDDSLWCPPENLEEAAENCEEPAGHWIQVTNDFDVLETHSKCFLLIVKGYI